MTLNLVASCAPHHSHTALALFALRAGREGQHVQGVLHHPAQDPVVPIVHKILWSLMYAIMHAYDPLFLIFPAGREGQHVQGVLRHPAQDPTSRGVLALDSG